MINLRQGDVVRFVLAGPANFNGVSDGNPLERTKATFIAFAGRKLKEVAWPAGSYEGLVQILRDGRVITEQKSQMSLP